MKIYEKPARYAKRAQRTAKYVRKQPKETRERSKYFLYLPKNKTELDKKVKIF